MRKNIYFYFTLFFLAGCATKPIVVVQEPEVKPEPKPVIKVEKIPTQIEEQVEVIELNTTLPLGQNVVIETVDTNETNMTIIEAIPEVDETLSKSNAKSYVTTLKTQQFSFSDAGFMRHENGIIDLQILALGKPLLMLKISEDICVDHHCRTKEEFNHNYLSEYYPRDLINNVLTSQPIFDGRNLRKTTKGFLQRIKTDEFDIKYKISPGSIYFKDLHNRIIIKLRELKQ